MAETQVVRCAACSLRIATQDGHYHLADGHFHPECYDRNQLEALARMLWARPPHALDAS